MCGTQQKTRYTSVNVGNKETLVTILCTSPTSLSHMRLCLSLNHINCSYDELKSSWVIIVAFLQLYNYRD